MKRNIIEMTEHGTVTIPSEVIWMSEVELVALFGVIAPTIRAAIKAIYKSEILKEYEAQRYIRLSDKVGMDVYNLEMVAALAFRIHSYGAERVRNALLNRMHGRKEKASLLLSLNFNGISDTKKEEFIRVGTTLYKIVNQPRLDGGYVKKRIVWNNETLRQDYGKDYLATISKYDGFCTVPDHVDYKPVIGKFLNLYEPTDHQPQQGDFPCIRSLVEHIFGEQYELGLDYIQLLYLRPIQKLPILLLVSEEHKRKFMAKEVKAKVFTDKGKFVLTIDLKPIGDWFKEQFEKWKLSASHSIRPQRKVGGLL